MTQAGPAPVLYADARLVILNKPPGLPCHAGRAGGASAEDFFAMLSRRKTGPWLAHRLDTDTAGCLAIALRKASLIALQALFATGRADKTYWAVVEGEPPATAGRIENRLGKVGGAAGWRMQAGAAGQPAISDWRWLGGDGQRSWLEIRPHTGRTHQVRVHCAGLGCPVLGDPVYGNGRGSGGGLHLLARALRLPLDPPAEAVAPPPVPMRAALAACGWRERITAPDARP